MNKYLLFLVILCSPICLTAQNNPLVEQLKQRTQELLDAVGTGDRTVWQKYLAEGSLYTDEEGNVLTKDELINELRPLPKGYIGSIKIDKVSALVQDNVVVLVHLDREELELFGQKILTNFQSTSIWAKQTDGDWKIVSTQVMAIPNERKPAAIEAEKLEDYIGQYKISSEITYTITREGDKLFGQRTGRSKEELLALCHDIFYRKGAWRGEKVFERDEKGKVIKMLDRRENNDLVWQKIK
jgi:hypothetical protein